MPDTQTAVVVCIALMLLGLWLLTIAGRLA